MARVKEKIELTYDKKHKGGRSELLACAWLLENGYEVFRNVSPHGYADLIAIKNGVVHLYDVKTGYYTREGRVEGPKLKTSQIIQKVKPLYVLPDGLCFIDLKPITLEEKYSIKICAKCFVKFIPTQIRQIYCTHKCRFDAIKAAKEVKEAKTKGWTTKW